MLDVKIHPPSVWRARPPPKANAPPAEAFIISVVQEMPSVDDYLIDPEYPV
jgi:hypothetical protein